MLSEIKDKLVEIVTALSGAGQPLKAVFAYGEPMPKQYPCAMVLWNTRTEERLDSMSNLASFSFVVRVLIREAATEDAEEQLMNLVDSITDALRSNANIDTLGGLVEMVDIGEAQRLHATEDQPVFGFDLLITCKKIKLIS